MQTGSGDKDIQYVMYLGTNDKDTYEPFGTAEEAKQKADELIKEFNQSTVLIQANESTTEFYSGAE